MIGVVVNDTSLTLNFDVERQGCAAMKSLPWPNPNKEGRIIQSNLITFARPKNFKTIEPAVTEKMLHY